MSKQQRYTEEFKIEAVKQVTERQHPVAEVAERLGVSGHSLYAWIKRYNTPPEQRQQDANQAAEIRRLGAWLASLTATRSPCWTRPTHSTKSACPALIARRKSSRSASTANRACQSLHMAAQWRSSRTSWIGGRMIGKVLVDGEDANLEQVRRGCGWHYKRYQNEQVLDDRLAYNAAEESARAGRVGLWTDREPVAPWEWRKARRK